MHCQNWDFSYVNFNKYLFAETSEMTEEECRQRAKVVERQESIEKQQIYEDAFLEQMDRYIKYGELESMPSIYTYFCVLLL